MADTTLPEQPKQDFEAILSSMQDQLDDLATIAEQHQALLEKLAREGAIHPDDLTDR